MADHPKQTDNKEKNGAHEAPDSPKKKEEDLELNSSPEVLKQFDAFEVEDMPESNELQDRRRKIKNQLKDLDVEHAGEEGSKAFSDSDEGGFMDLLREAGLGSRQFKFCCGGIVVLVLLGALIYGGVKWFGSSDFSFNFGGDEGTEEPVSSDDDDDTGDDDDDDTTQSGTGSYPDSTLWTGMDLGDPEQNDTETTDTGEDLGLEGNGDDSLQKHINDFSKVYEVAQVDVNEILNSSSDRREALQDYVDELNFYYHLALQSQEELSEENDTLARAFSAVEEDKNEQEGLFFAQLDALDAYSSTAALNSFVGYSQELIRLRAHYLAREKLLGYYEQTIPYLETKIVDIQLNEEALVKGIQVVEVEGSDLNLIQSASDL